MKINIVYASWFGNGSKVVKELADILKAKNQEVTLYRVNEKIMDNLPFADLYIFSTPTRKFALPPEMEKSVENFSLNLEGSKYALITTYLDPRTIALKKLESILEKKKMVKMVDDLKIRVKGLKGILEENYKVKINKFAEDIINNLLPK